jgi:branched-subunit amino acid aminotransferase/4-amino-4-deoxychorismate lyase
MSTLQCFELRGTDLVANFTSAATLDDLSLELPDGVYTTLRTYRGNRVLHLDAHFDRLVESARLEGVALRLDRGLLRRAIATLIASTGFQLARVRLTVGLSPAVRIFLAAEELRELPEDAYRFGVTCDLADRALLRELPESKSTRFIGPGAIARHMAPAANGDQREILEGSSSNFFAVVDGVLRTAGMGVLAGTTRAMVLLAAQGLLTIEYRPVSVDEIPGLREAFVTSVGRGVLPVVTIGGQAIGDGVPGPYTLEIRRRYSSALEAELEPIVGA